MLAFSRVMDLLLFNLNLSVSVQRSLQWHIIEYHWPLECVPLNIGAVSGWRSGM